MLPKDNRLKLPVPWQRKEPDFQIKTSSFKVLAKRVSTKKAARAGFIISNKVGKATVRNQIRRKLIAQIRLNLAKIDSSLDLVWVVYPNITKESDEEISTNFNKVLSKISV